MALLRLVRTAVVSKCLPKRDHVQLLEWRDELERLAAKFGFPDARHAGGGRGNKGSNSASGRNAIHSGHSALGHAGGVHGGLHALPPNTNAAAAAAAAVAAAAAAAAVNGHGSAHPMPYNHPGAGMLPAQMLSGHVPPNGVPAPRGIAPAGAPPGGGGGGGSSTGTIQRASMYGAAGWPQPSPRALAPRADAALGDDDDHEMNPQTHKSITDLLNGTDDDDDLAPSTSFDFGLSGFHNSHLGTRVVSSL